MVLIWRIQGDSIMIKKSLQIIIYCVSLILLFMGRWLSWDIIYNKMSVVAGMIYLWLDIIYIIFFCIASIRTIHICVSKKWKGVIMLLSCLCAVMVYGFGNTVMNIKLNHCVNKTTREKIVEMIQDGNMEPYRIGMNAYKTPYRMTSQTNKIYYENTDNLKVLFSVNQDLFGGAVIIYVSNDSTLNGHEFDIKYKKIEKLENNWYYGIL